MELLAPTPLRRIGGNKYYYRLRCDGGEVYLQTKRFFSNPPFKSYSKLSMYLAEESGVVEELREILTFCKENAVRPEGAPTSWNMERVWRQFERSGYFASLSDAFQAFDAEKKAIPMDRLKRGYYTLRLHLPGVYLGENGSHVCANLQVKVTQLIFEPEMDNSVCLID